MCKFVKWLDPKLDKYRPRKSPPKPNSYAPKTLKEFVGLLQRTPRSILSKEDRNRIAAIMSFEDRHVGDLMTARSQMLFFNEAEVLGPLTLDKLYKSGFTDFPVTDRTGKITGIIHTEALNALAIKKTDRASKYLDRTIHYLHATDSLKFAVEEIERLSASYFLVLDDGSNTIGCFTVQMLLDYLLG